MQIVPVIDLKDGHVVRGVAGRRAEYQRIDSQLVAGSTPAGVSCALAEYGVFQEIYVADLDAIAGKPPNYTALAEIAETQLRIWIDLGLSGRHVLDEAREALSAAAPDGAISGIIVGLESLDDPAAIAAFSDVAAECRLIFSLDLYRGAAWNPRPAWQSLDPIEIAQRAVAAGFRRIIVLDLADVGVGDGTHTTELVAEIGRRAPAIERIAGGGVRGIADLDRLKMVGCSHALVASALHDGRLTRSQLREFQGGRGHLPNRC